MSQGSQEELAEFVDRQTLRYLRFYPVAVEEVWRAVTSADHLNVWLLPVCRVDAREGGHCSFSWGAPEDPTYDGHISIFEPMRRVRYETPAGHIEFALAPVEGGTDLAFTQYFRPDFEHPPETFDPDDPGAEGPDGATPWRVGFIAGFHVSLETLGTHLGRALGEDAVRDQSERNVATANEVGKGAFESEGDGDFARLLQRYLAHVRETYPG